MKIDNFRGDYSFLSNFYRAKVQRHGKMFLTSEHAFQAAKTIIPQEIKAIQEIVSPAHAKSLGAKCSLRPDWEDVKYGIMKDIIFRKFTQNKVLLFRLQSTKDSKLIEGNIWHDNYWGDCKCIECHDIRGMNMLGKILMEVRRTL